MTNESAKELLRGRVHKFKEILYRDEPFTIRDLDGGPSKNNRSILQVLRQSGAIEKNQRLFPEGNNGKKLIQYEWVKHQEYLQNYFETRPELPCGCRAHIPPERTEDGEFVCKFCGATVSREAVKEAL